MHLFYTPDIKSDLHTLNEKESTHCIKVLRLFKGSLVYLVDGKGGFYKAAVEKPDPKKCVVRILEHTIHYGRRNYHPDRFKGKVTKRVVPSCSEVVKVMSPPCTRAISRAL